MPPIALMLLLDATFGRDQCTDHPRCPILWSLNSLPALAGKWTVQQAAELSVPAPTIEAALDGRFLAGLKDQRVTAAKYYADRGVVQPKTLEVSLHASLCCCFTQHWRAAACTAWPLDSTRVHCLRSSPDLAACHMPPPPPPHPP